MQMGSSPSSERFHDNCVGTGCHACLVGGRRGNAGVGLCNEEHNSEETSSHLPPSFAPLPAGRLMTSGKKRQC